MKLGMRFPVPVEIFASFYRSTIVDSTSRLFYSPAAGFHPISAKELLRSQIEFRSASLAHKLSRQDHERGPAQCIPSFSN